MANKAIKYRAHPTTEQRVMFAKTFGCCRKVYNLMLTDKIAHYKATGKSIQTTPAQWWLKQEAQTFISQSSSPKKRAISGSNFNFSNYFPLHSQL